jgi:hypothetical protein
MNMKAKNYNDRVEAMSVAIHESWARSRQTMIDRYNNIADAKGRTMKDRWEKDMVPYFQLPEDTKEYDRMEARGQLAATKMLPPYVTDGQRKQWHTCVTQHKKAGMDVVEARIACFMQPKLQCTPTWRDDPNRGCASYAFSDYWTIHNLIGRLEK